jgi:hypothetical protein
MALRFQPATLDGNYGDEEAMLVLNDGRILAVLSRLGPAHDELEGCWFLEKGFGALSEGVDGTFADMAAVEAWIGRR